MFKGVVCLRLSAQYSKRDPRSSEACLPSEDFGFAFLLGICWRKIIRRLVRTARKTGIGVKTIAVGERDGAQHPHCEISWRFVTKEQSEGVRGWIYSETANVEGFLQNRPPRILAEGRPHLRYQCDQIPAWEIVSEQTLQGSC